MPLATVAAVEIGGYFLALAELATNADALT
jgi:hypothetical protein